MFEKRASTDDAGPAEETVGSDEVALVRRAQMGSASAFEQLVRERGADLHKYLVLRLRNESDARDALQETLTAAWISLPTLREPTRFWPWLVAIARHKAADIARMTATEAGRADVTDTPDERVMDVRDALDRLPTRFREILLLRYGLELSEREAADLLGLRVGTIKSRSARARKALEELLR